MDPVLILPDGTPARTGYLNPDELRFAAVPAWDEANPVLPEAEWEEHDDYAPFWDDVRAQQNNNCTNAALGGLAECLFRAAGVADVPRLSWSYLYARHNGGRDAGAFCRDLAADFKDRGLPPAAAWPDDRIYPPRGGFPPAVLEAAARWRGLEVYQCLDWRHVASALTRRFLVYHGFVMGAAYARTGRDGRVPEWDGRFAAGHAMFSRGLTRRFGDWRTVTPNSWGRSFGANGYGYWPASYFWAARGNYVNLDCYAVRAPRRADLDGLPKAA